AIGRQTKPQISIATPAVPSVPTSTPVTALTPVPNETPVVATKSDTTESESSDNSAADIISRIKAALGRSSNRKTYSTLSKLADSIDQKNVHEILGFIDALQKPQEKSMLLSLVVGRWSEFDPQSAIAYAQ